MHTGDAESAEITEQRKKRDGLKPAPTATHSFYWWAAGCTLRTELPMSAEPARRTIGMTLRQLVDLYLSKAGRFGNAVALTAFQLSAAETQHLFSSYDEDYHISRFFHFTEAEGVKFGINGIPVTHVSLDAEIETIL